MNHLTSHPFPIGFSATGARVGLSKKRGKKDMALFFSHLPANGGALFTSNRVKAAPLILTRERILKTNGRVRAVVVNTGSANAATGSSGLEDARRGSLWVAKGLGVSVDEVWVASTGVIGTRINMKRYRKGVKILTNKVRRCVGLREQHIAAESIMTTDTVPKVAGARFAVGGVPVRLWGACKGAGMIHPQLRNSKEAFHATMLAFLLTDANIMPFVIEKALLNVAENSFNCISVDGDTSTNDFVALLANGASGAPPISNTRGAHYEAFVQALFHVCDDLTTQMVKDGEGASKLIRIWVKQARTKASARHMASVIASSPLVKTACHGADPNWGRILAAMGRSGISFDPSKVSIFLGPIRVCKNGREFPFSEKKAIRYMRGDEIDIHVFLSLGSQSALFKTCDFTGQYVGINAGYRT